MARKINKVRVSVVMPIYNCEKYVTNSINSVLNQTFRDFEFIILDDASTDNTLSIINDFAKKDKRIVLRRNRNNLGVTKSLNKALKYVKGEYVIRMDGDDWSHPSRFVKQVNLMDRNPDVVVSGSYIWVCDSNLNIKQVRKYNVKDSEIRNKLFRYSPFAHPATIWRTDVIKKEKYNERIKYGQDYELYFRVGRHGKFMNIPRPLLKLRMHASSISSKMSNAQSRATIEIRYIAKVKFGYKMRFTDKIYNYSQFLLIWLIPVWFRFFLFNFLRRFDFF